MQESCTSVQYMQVTTRTGNHVNSNSNTTTYLSTALIIGGFLLIALAWNGAANEFLVDKQIPFVVSGGLTGIGMIIAGCTLAVVQELRTSAAEVGARLDRLAAAVRGEEAASPFEDTLPEPREHTGSTIEREPGPATG